MSESKEVKVKKKKRWHLNRKFRKLLLIHGKQIIQFHKERLLDFKSILKEKTARLKENIKMRNFAKGSLRMKTKQLENWNRTKEKT